MRIRQFDIWLANLNPQRGTEPGKIRPVLIVQTNLLNRLDFPSTLICPITSNVKGNYSEILRVNVKKHEVNLDVDSSILIDQVRAIDNKRLLRKITTLPDEYALKVKDNLKIILDL